jgi:hypothetical protein
MTELAHYEPGNEVAQRQDAMQNRAVARLGEWAQAAGAAYEVAKGLVGTAFVPAQYNGKPEEATAAILAGAEVGLSPMASLKAFDNIQGTAAPKAITLRAIVQSQGHEMILDESTETRCKMRGRRRGQTEWIKVTWTMDRAKGLGLTNKDNWKKQPTAMLVARATGELARLVAADAILGIGYTVEEVADGADVELAPDGDTPDAEQPAKRTMKRKPPTEDGEQEALPEHGPRLTEAQSKRMFAQFTELGITERDDYQAYIAKVIKREVESSKDLTPEQASAVIDAQIADIEAKAGAS